MKNHIVILLSCLMLISCSNSNEFTGRMGKETYTMQEMPYKQFLLDENTTQNTNYIQLLIVDDSLRFTMFNPAKNNILIFDLLKGNVLDSIQLYKEGPDGVSNNIRGYYIINMDSVYLYDYWAKMLILVNHTGKIINKNNLSEMFIMSGDDSVIPSSPFPTTDLPIRIVNNHVILQGMNGPMKSQGNQMPMSSALFDFSKNTMLFANPYPKIYGDPKEITESWGTFSYRVVPYDLNDNNQMVLSFPADDSISVYDVVTHKTKRYFAGYSKEDIIKPLRKKTMVGDMEHYLENTQYAGIFFDKYRELYFRLVLNPLYDYDPNDPKTQIKKIGIIILDKDFNKVGEYDLKDKTDRYRNCFVSPDGFHIHILSDDDDYLKFITLKPIKI